MQSSWKHFRYFPPIAHSSPGGQLFMITSEVGNLTVQMSENKQSLCSLPPVYGSHHAENFIFIVGGLGLDQNCRVFTDNTTQASRNLMLDSCGDF